MMGHMFGYGYPTSINWWWLIGFSVLRLLILIGIVALIIRTINKGRRDREINNTSNRAIEILKEKYDLGEISEEEHQRKINILRS
ncbi:SHOCT domain-containing protein [Sporosalibacterium faouarense]|uniref:SHOCT domain-containing protein n=1 Tax=Sporosalibacterium faouarense TaxID=516123 RepID=UPI00192A87A6|nr:SHOCT domain-containing protein [Sporosalibacterium faouarense]